MDRVFLLIMLHQIIARMTEPPANVVDLRQRREIRILRGVLLTMFISGSIFVPAYWLSIEIASILDFFPDAFYVLIIGALYLFVGRYPHYHIVAGIFIIMTLFATYTVAIPADGGPYHNSLLVYLALPVLFAAFFFHESIGVGIILANILGIIIWSYMQPNVGVFDTEIGYITIISSLFTAIMYYQRTIFHEQERQIRQSEARYRNLVDELPDAIFVFSAGQIRYLNQSASVLLGGDDVEYHNKPLAGLFHTEMLQKLMNYMDAPSGHQIEDEFITRLGRRVPVEISWTHLEDDGETVCQLIVHDISERKRQATEHLAYEIERERNAAMKAFVGDLSHDIKTPLTAIRTNLHLLQHMLQDESILERVNTVDTQAQRIHSMIDDLLTIVELEDRSATEHLPLNLSIFMKKVFKDFYSIAEQSQIALTLETPNQPLMVLADEDNLYRGVANLLENALRYTPAGQSIVCRLWQTDNLWATFEIKDQGIGIPADDLKQIFERFYRARQARYMIRHGTGLGLSIVQKVFQLHRGHVLVCSEEGQGTTVRFYLPLVSNHATT